VLVTGVAGFIGSSVAEALLARGDDVVGVDEVRVTTFLCSSPLLYIA
jgi:nucleoside-diphosphate-sugar epimerase